MSKRADTQVDRFARHARKFGTEGVMESAAECEFLSFEELVELQKALDRIEKQQAGRYQSKNRRLSAETRVKRLLGIEEEGDGPDQDAA